MQIKRTDLVELAQKAFFHGFQADPPLDQSDLELWEDHAPQILGEHYRETPPEIPDVIELPARAFAGALKLRGSFGLDPQTTITILSNGKTIKGDDQKARKLAQVYDGRFGETHEVRETLRNVAEVLYGAGLRPFVSAIEPDPVSLPRAQESPTFPPRSLPEPPPTLAPEGLIPAVAEVLDAAKSNVAGAIAVAKAAGFKEITEPRADPAD